MKRWLFPKTQEDKWRTIGINFNIIFVLLILQVILVIVKAFVL